MCSVKVPYIHPASLLRYSKCVNSIVETRNVIYDSFVQDLINSSSIERDLQRLFPTFPNIRKGKPISIQGDFECKRFIRRFLQKLSDIC